MTSLVSVVIPTHERPDLLGQAVADCAKLQKFAAELERLPRQRAASYGSIGFHHSLLGEWREAGRWFWRAVSSQPFYPGAYRSLLRSGKALVLRTLHRRRRAAPA